MRGAEPRINPGRGEEDKEIASPSACNDRKEGPAMTQGRVIFVTITGEGPSQRAHGLRPEGDRFRCSALPAIIRDVDAVRQRALQDPILITAYSFVQRR